MTKEKWLVHGKKADFEAIGRQFGISPITARIIRNRDIEGDNAIRQYLEGGLEELYDPCCMKDMEEAVVLLTDKISQKKKIRIVGDYDIDGVCATYILYTGLQRVGAVVDYDIPDRIKDGYGINEMIVKKAWEEETDTLLTCDNGISALAQIEVARELGMTVIITDHHEVPRGDNGQILPPANLVVNPKREDCHYPYPEICGGLVAYKLIQALYQSFGVEEEELLALLEFAAIATVGDVMKLQNENRLVVKYGLKRIGRTENLGLRKLIEKNNLDPEHLSAYHIGFVIGPCLNAGGRLSSAKLALELLLTGEEERAEKLSQKLKELNDMRKDMTAQGLLEARAMVDTFYRDDKVLVVFLPQCHESLAGIIAGRLREAYHKPSIVLTSAEENVKGSGRSIEQYHMFLELNQVSDLLLKFGGHPMAAGLSIKEANIEEFRRRLNENAKLTEEDFIPKIWIDVPMPLEYISEGLIHELSLLEPYGQGNEKPQFAQKALQVISARVMGKNQNVVKLSLISREGTAMDGLIFTDGPSFMEEMGDRRSIDIIYYPGINEYNGNRSLQITIKNYEFSK